MLSRRWCYIINLNRHYVKKSSAYARQSHVWMTFCIKKRFFFWVALKSTFLFSSRNWARVQSERLPWVLFSFWKVCFQWKRVLRKEPFWKKLLPKFPDNSVAFKVLFRPHLVKLNAEKYTFCVHFMVHVSRTVPFSLIF